MKKITGNTSDVSTEPSTYDTQNSECGNPSLQESDSVVKPGLKKECIHMEE